MEPQQSKKRFRGNGVERELLEVLSFAKSLEKLEADDALAISRMKLTQTRIATLTLLSNRKRHNKLRKVTDDLRSAKAEIEKLRFQLTAALAVKPMAREKSDVERALEIAAKEKSDGHQV
jgi:hypothetical protein